ncbi:PorT family protein [Fulvivirga sp. M361]|uniref:porin family protein n=1 Tax=Fulvivirga sp. M361 TaxID=2594266 RepID=UPI00117B3494|nr:porin family protein [Fulvivirga sp. M361]TRX62088.1 PorT family protein [Fulvivirga sp. M361]
MLKYVTISVSPVILRIIIAALAINVISSSILYSQSWEFGIKGGPLFSNVNSTSQFEEVNRKGYYIGLFVQKEITQITSLETGIFYAAQGTQLERTFPRANTKVILELNANYIRMPLTFNVKPVPFFHFFAGPYFSYLAGVSSSRQGDFFNSFNELNRDDFNLFDFGTVIGGSFLIQSVAIGISWHTGLNKIIDNSQNALIDSEAKNRALVIHVSYRLPLAGDGG